MVKLVASDSSIQPLLRAAGLLNSLRLAIMFGATSDKFIQTRDAISENLNEYVKAARRELETDGGLIHI